MQNAAESLLALIDMATILADNAEQLAKAKRELFLAYKKEGFTEEQALNLVKGLNL